MTTDFAPILEAYYLELQYLSDFNANPGTRRYWDAIHRLGELDRTIPEEKREAFYAVLSAHIASHF